MKEKVKILIEQAYEDSQTISEFKKRVFQIIDATYSDAIETIINVANGKSNK